MNCFVSLFCYWEFVWRLGDFSVPNSFSCKKVWRHFTAGITEKPWKYLVCGLSAKPVQTKLETIITVYVCHAYYALYFQIYDTLIRVGVFSGSHIVWIYMILCGHKIDCFTIGFFPKHDHYPIFHISKYQGSKKK